MDCAFAATLGAFIIIYHGSVACQGGQPLWLCYILPATLSVAEMVSRDTFFPQFVVHVTVLLSLVVFVLLIFQLEVRGLSCCFYGLLLL